ncbi:MAG: bifunctional 4-hydroxy-2-oxoglutarate aldolase/2-dehydro-3-deoxy-phosphogluconate aldolase [Succinivibrio sp.]|nr:bifunctional 4-hydroxy-2-oxoglutarate aldolase/2-dehydro-3-deoxy-phosphogluconate aldolase [Succinivibrio sp.]
MDVVNFICTHKLVAISRQIYGQGLLSAAKILVDNGIHLLEITFDQNSPDCLQDTAAAIALIKEQLGDKICVGAGTVMSVEQARAAKDAGADFALAPNVDVEVIAQLRKLQLVAVPGALTPSEIALAYKAGADIVKVFPVANLGFEYLKAIRGPLNHIPLMAVGGVNADNVSDFLKAGCCSAGIGSNLLSRKKVDAGDFEQIKRSAAQLVAAVK